MKFNEVLKDNVYQVDCPWYEVERAVRILGEKYEILSCTVQDPGNGYNNVLIFVRHK